ncbi:MAG: efflux RND transporter periplasmic adaptor subunit [Bacteroidetes bacterium]|nr:efflux RND transporter periplasmic adaptor subunit [Bacteroidota bacterium]
MNKFNIINLSVIVGFMTLVQSCTSNKEDNSNTNKIEARQEVPVKTMIVKKEEINKTIEFTATLIPFEEIYLAPVSPGKIERIYVEIGDRASKGQIVATMNKSNLEQAKINLLNLETNFKRMETLKKTNTISEQQFDQVNAAYKAAEVSYQFLLDNTQIKAPFNGIVSGKYYEDGENFSGAPNTAAGKSAIVTIVQINQLKALIGLSASYFPQISEGMTADISCDIYPDQKFKGEIYQKYPTIDNATKTFTVEVKIPNEDLMLRPGMFCTIDLNLGKGKAILVPTIALIKQTGTNDMYVFLNKNNIAIKQPIKTGRIIDDKTEILAGISDGDQVIVVGQNKLENQMPVTINK